MRYPFKAVRVSPRRGESFKTRFQRCKRYDGARTLFNQVNEIKQPLNGEEKRCIKARHKVTPNVRTEVIYARWLSNIHGPVTPKKIAREATIGYLDSVVKSLPAVLGVILVMPAARVKI